MADTNRATMGGPSVARPSHHRYGPPTEGTIAAGPSGVDGSTQGVVELAPDPLRPPVERRSADQPRCAPGLGPAVRLQHGGAALVLEEDPAANTALGPSGDAP